MRWNHVGLKASDLDRSLYFYCDILGLRRLEEVNILGKDFYFVGNDTITIEIEAGNPGDTRADVRSQTGLYHLSFTVSDIEKTIEHLKESGVSILMEPFKTRPDRKTSFIEDPDGVHIQLIEYLS